jgi:hypothetical protein
MAVKFLGNHSGTNIVFNTQWKPNQYSFWTASDYHEMIKDLMLNNMEENVEANCVRLGEVGGKFWGKKNKLKDEPLRRLSGEVLSCWRLRIMEKLGDTRSCGRYFEALRRLNWAQNFWKTLNVFGSFDCCFKALESFSFSFLEKI